MADEKRPTLLMLAAHEPCDDPRIDWAARTASQFFNTTVLGLHGYSVNRPDIESFDTYSVVRVRPPRAFQRKFVLHILRGGAEYAVKRIYRPASFSEHSALGFVKPLFVAAFTLVALAAMPVEVILGALADAMCLIWRWRPHVASRMIGAVLEVHARSAPSSAIGRLLYYCRRAGIFFDALRHVWHVAQAFWQAAIVMPKSSVIYCNDLDTLLPGLLLAKAFGAKLIYDSHEYWPYSNVEAPRIHVWFFCAMERFMSRSADAALTVSGPLAAELERAYRLRKVHVVPNAAPWSERVPGRKLPFSEIARFSAGRVSFLFQGNFAPQRGLEELIDAWAEMDTAKAALFLRGPDNHWRQGLADRARRLGLLDRSVFILPPVATAELISAACEADVGLIPYKADLPAYRYACPNKLSQYMHAGVAILTNDIPYVAEMVTTADCGAVYNGNDQRSIVAAVMQLAGDCAALDRLKKNALVYGRDIFNWQVQSSALVDIFRNFAASRH